MNLLARVVHNMMTGKVVPPYLTELSQSEQAALADLQNFVNQPPKKLAAFLASEKQGGDWLKKVQLSTSDLS